MKTRTLLNSFFGLGAVLTLASALWWGVVYYFVSQQNSESMWSSLNCMYSLSQECNVLRAMGWLRGINPYEPLLFWLGLTVLAMSLLLRSSLSSESRR